MPQIKTKPFAQSYSHFQNEKNKTSSFVSYVNFQTI